MAITFEKVQDLSTTVILKFQKGLEGYKAVYKEVAPTIPSNGSANVYPLGNLPAIKEWTSDRDIKDLTEGKYILENKLWESTLTIPRTAIEDDNYGFYTMQASGLGIEASQHPDTLLSTVIMNGFTTGVGYDGKTFFASDHEGPAGQTYSNVQTGTGEPWVLVDGSKAMPAFFHQERVKYTMEKPTDLSEYTFMKDKYLFGMRGRGAVGYGLHQLAFGSKAELTKENFESALTSMISVKKLNGNSAGVMPTHIIVGPQNYTKALELFKTIYQSSSSNVYYERVKIVMLPWLQADVSTAKASK